MAVSFDLFGTLVAVARPADPAEAVARQLRQCGVAVPDDWAAAYREPQVTVEPGAELALSDHVRHALASRGVDADAETVAAAVREAFDGPVDTREGAESAVAAAAEGAPVGILSNCSVDGLVERTLARSELDADRFDAIVASVDCGWRKPDRRAFETVARALDAPVADLVHVGDDPATDGGADDAGASSVLLPDTDLADLPARLEAMGCR
ncbi:HAD superfamily hydrolase [Halosimplex carlsbadense 2-9-1]|uniref:HAD superfamily hydrolase n=1 Tax=Halosimplex carlsbadense 2-9-1 TaxID=797114 RepID=M0D8V5_9EURY|nr:HAD family hydrolase [Halosimplex carlsbadense]ELZ30574.1 HAD superfamily hydrolase [Halosimplex carlsbadense 2-9-1]